MVCGQWQLWHIHMVRPQDRGPTPSRALTHVSRSVPADRVGEEPPSAGGGVSRRREQPYALDDRESSAGLVVLPSYGHAAVDADALLHGQAALRRGASAQGAVPREGAVQAGQLSTGGRELRVSLSSSRPPLCRSHVPEPTLRATKVAGGGSSPQPCCRPGTVASLGAALRRRGAPGSWSRGQGCCPGQAPHKDVCKLPS